MTTDKIVLLNDYVKSTEKFNIKRRSFEFRIKPIPEESEPVSWIREAIDQIIEKATAELEASDRVGFTFSSQQFKQDGWIRFRPAEEVSTDDVWEMISSICQSNDVILKTETFLLEVTIAKTPIGRGRGKRYNTYEEECRSRGGIIYINNTDNLCLPRALVVAIAKVNKDNNYREILKDTRKVQTENAHALCRDARVEIPETGAGFKEIEAFQRFLSAYRIIVYTYRNKNKGREVFFEGPSSECPRLNLLHHEGHYSVICSLTAAFQCSYYCEDCHVPYNTKNYHRCARTCPCCQQSPRCPKNSEIKCDDCNRGFRGELCFENHKKDKSLSSGTVCAQLRMCSECFKTVKTNRKHQCGEIFCKTCRGHKPENHLCFMQIDKGKPKTEKLLFIFYDLETRQETVLDNGSVLHEPNICVFKQCCYKCLDLKENICKECGDKLKILNDKDIIPNFLDHILTIRKKFKQVVVIGHNAGRFDHQFLLSHILTKTDLEPKIITNGTKMILMVIDNVKFLDSINYFSMPLSKLPKAFGLVEMKKGYFPHLFNITQNENYEGILPELKFYNPDAMKEDERSQFLKWYEHNKNDSFNMRLQLKQYCESDVDILKQACLHFRKLMLEQCNVCPFTEAVTIASACNKVFRRNFLRPDTIAIIPKKGYRMRDKQSLIAIRWLIWEEKQRKINITHAAKNREEILKGIKVDGYCQETKQVFQFYGCYYHGCKHCYNYNRNAPLNKSGEDTFDNRYETTEKIAARLKNLGYEVIETWECTFKRMLKDNKELDECTKNHPLLISPPLNPRDAFYGGRTGNTWQYYKCKYEERIKYIDICSLYPWVCKYGKFPIGHPEVLVGNKVKDIDISKISGLIKCKVLPPQRLYHPVLPTKMNKKLMFLLCRTCGEEMCQEECDHSESERAITGTWMVEELHKAIQKGYEILEIYEIWSYQTEQYNPIERKGGFFVEMMNKFIKIKQQASGWPSKDLSQEEKEKYIEEFLSKEGIELEFREIVENPGLRSLAKLMLNSFWGKFGQRENQPQTSIISDTVNYHALMNNPLVHINSIHGITDHTVVVSWEHIEEVDNELQLATVNVALAIYVTAQARLKLYSYLENLGERVLYYDTDSVIYISRKEEWNPPTSEFVGDMTDELKPFGEESYITEFVSGGPKNYAYKVWSTKNESYEVVCKVKGISLTHAASQSINFDSIKDMVLENREPITIVSNVMRRNKNYQVVTQEQSKIYRHNSTKRKFFENHSSIPFGYKKLKPIEQV